MKRKWGVLLALVLLPALCLPVRALYGGGEDGPEQLVDVDGLRRAAQESGGTAEYGTTLDEGLEGLLDTGTRELRGAVRRAARSGALLLVILLFCALAESVGELGRGSV